MNEDLQAKIFWFRTLHIVACLFTLVVGPALLNKAFGHLGGSGDGAGMRALGVLIGYAAELLVAVPGLIIIHKSHPKTLVSPTMILMTIASVFMYISEIPLYIIYTFAMLPVYFLVSRWVDKKINKIFEF